MPTWTPAAEPTETLYVALRIDTLISAAICPDKLGIDTSLCHPRLFRRGGIVSFTAKRSVFFNKKHAHDYSRENSFGKKYNILYSFALRTELVLGVECCV